MVSAGIIAGVVALLFWGFSDYFSAIAAREIDTFRSYFWANLVGLIFLVIYAIFNGVPPISRVIWILLVAALFNVVAVLAYFEGMRIGRISIMAPITYGWSLITMLLSVIFLREFPTFIQTLTIFLIVIGTLLASYKPKDLINFKWKKASKELLYALVAMVLYGLMGYLVAIASKQVGWFLPIFLIKIFGGMYLLIFALGKKMNLKVRLDKSIIPLTLSGVLMTIAFLSYSYGVGSEYTSIVAPISAASPALTVLLAKIFLKEKLGITQNIGVVIVLVGLIILSL